MKLLILLLSLFISAELAAETRYVSDSLTVFLRSGPTHQFRIVGTLKAGEAIDIIADDLENKASHVRLSNGREGWLDTEQLMSNKPSSLLYTEVSAELKKVTADSIQQISNLQQDLIQARNLAAQSQLLQQQVTQLEYDKELLEQKNQSLSERSRYDLLTAGGVVALAGLLLGLILPRFIRRKRNDVWR